MTDKEIIKEAIRELLEEENKSFFVERESHYQDHLFIKDMRDWCEGIKSTFWKTTAKAVVMGIIGLLILGFIFWGKGHLKP